MYEALLKARDFSAAPVDRNLRTLFDGLLNADWRQALIARGFGWHTDVGAFSTPAAGGGAAAVIDQDRPNLLISVTAGYTIIPLRFHVACLTPLLATDADESEILIAADIAAAAAGYAGNGTIETPTNLRSNVASGCPAVVYSTASGNITNPTLGMELGHAIVVGDLNGTPANALWGELKLVYEPLHPPLLVGPCAVYVYHGGTVATTGFINADFLVVPSQLVTGLA